MNATEASGLSCSTYFEALPDDVFVKLIRRLDKVRYRNSENERTPGTAASTGGGKDILSFLFSEDGPFYSAVSSVVTKVRLSPVREPSNIFYGAITIGPELFEAEERKNRLVERILKVCGKSTKGIWLVVDDSQKNENRFIRQFVYLVLQHCTAVERVEFTVHSRFPGEDIVFTMFSKFSSRLRSISLCMWKSADTLRFPDFKNCRQIRHLSLPAMPQLRSLLECAGSVVESLNVAINTFEGYGEVIDAIEKNCKKLIHITFEDSKRVIKCVGEERYGATAW